MRFGKRFYLSTGNIGQPAQAPHQSQEQRGSTLFANKTQQSRSAKLTPWSRYEFSYLCGNCNSPLLPCCCSNGTNTAGKLPVSTARFSRSSIDRGLWHQ